MSSASLNDPVNTLLIPHLMDLSDYIIPNPARDDQKLND